MPPRKALTKSSGTFDTLSISPGLLWLLVWILVSRMAFALSAPPLHYAEVLAHPPALSLALERKKADDVSFFVA